MSRIDFSYEPDLHPAPRVVAVAEGPGYRIETWRFMGEEGDDVPASVCLPEGGGPWPAVIMGHGVHSDRNAEYIAGASQAWARLGFAVAAADAPFHGERGGNELVPHALLAVPDFVRRAVIDGRRLLDAVDARPDLDDRIGYVGFSMGTSLGVPLMAADSRIRAGVFCIGGSTRVRWEEVRPDPSSPGDEFLEATDPVAYAPEVAPRPVLMLNADNDQIFSRRSMLALYDAFEHPKELVLFPGTHAEWKDPGRRYRTMFAFLRDSLG
ncbi:MAG: alpha/beta hydrolase family protein [Acidimicrobiia bacterium]